jgi:hypothetical protein
VDAKRFLTALAVVFTIGDMIAYIALRRWGWEKSADFDIIGFMWLLINIPRLVAWLGFYFSLAVTVYLWVMALIAKVTDRDEETLGL